ncbi:uncharacterized protein LOC131431588 [Malaya genurostris]|uniref:uncharacterized protein LOC131431588 n=1 Tax=Malaya genurostris TaxID=325434 RepID=UPI0026F3D8BC|nr:uncharacterized protein LOC131431588 [Malaya genurostris]
MAPKFKKQKATSTLSQLPMVHNKQSGSAQCKIDFKAIERLSDNRESSIPVVLPPGIIVKKISTSVPGIEETFNRETVLSFTGSQPSTVFPGQAVRVETHDKSEDTKCNASSYNNQDAQLQELDSSIQDISNTADNEDLSSSTIERLVKIEKMLHASNLYHATNKRCLYTLMRDMKSVITHLGNVSISTAGIKMPVLNDEELANLENYSETAEGKAVLRQRFEGENSETLYNYCRHFSEQLFEHTSYPSIIE